MTRGKAYLIISLISALSVFCLFQLPRLSFDYDFDNFFPMGDQNWKNYQRYVNEYGYDNDYLLISARNDAGVFKTDFLTRIDSLAQELNKLQGIEKVVTPLSAQKIVRSPFGVFTVPYLHFRDQQRLKSDSAHLKTHPNLANNLINNQGNAVALVLYHERYFDKTEESELSQRIEQMISGFNFDHYHIAGRIQAQHVFISLIRDNFLLFLALSSFLIIVVLYLMFRRIRWVIVPLLIIGLSVIASLAAMAIGGKSIDILSSMLPTILLVVAMSDITHFLTRYFDLTAKGKPKIEAIRLTIREVGISTFLTSITTAIGFATLIVTSSLPVKNLGLYTAIGVLLTYIITFALFPSVATLTSPPKTTLYHQWWNVVLGKLFVGVLRKRMAILGAYAVLITLSIYGVTFLNNDTFLISDFPQNHQVTKDFMFFDDEFQGSKPFEVEVMVKDPSKDIFDTEILAEIDKVGLFLREEYQTDNLLSPADLVKLVNMSFHGGQPEFYGLPESNKAFQRVKRQLPQVEHYYPLNLVNEDKTRGRFTGFTKDVGSNEGLRQARRLKEYLAANVNHELVVFELTGTSYLFDLTTDSLVNNIIYGLALAISIVGLIMALLFKSLRVMIIAMIPNLIPILILAGLMGFFSIPLRLSTSIIFAIAFGIAVDDTIHFLSRYRLEVGRRKKCIYSLMHTYLSTGKAMVITTMILSAGFLIFLFSSFQATFYTGLLISIALFMALIVDLTLLPILLMIIQKK